MNAINLIVPHRYEGMWVFDDARVGLDKEPDGRFAIEFRQPGLLRPLSGAELSDGTLRFLLWFAALLTPRPPSMMVLNEPETSLHPNLLPALSLDRESLPHY
jgi:predicted ATPase